MTMNFMETLHAGGARYGIDAFPLDDCLDLSPAAPAWLAGLLEGLLRHLGNPGPA
ncbi:hypothetical protein LK540_19890 [Massilia sp. IC2-278]|uniref:hypothetical protein n=1 Tax=Massilia sp. IC2-278 TaxID=2887200 RepID=UPI001E52A24B|nr:hypothetical protein [Massilia sp. IC2-278]MCC2962696.1 hypothetical protein [Massilia sp. IC2-278]